MTAFAYRVIDYHGAEKKGVLDAVSLDKAITELQRQGLIPLEVKQQFTVDGSRSNWFSLALSKRRSNNHLRIQCEFSRNLAALINSGIPLDKILAILVELEKHPKHKKSLQSIEQQVKQGATLSAALETSAFSYSKLFIAMTRIGEQTGKLGTMLEHLADHLEQSNQLRDDVIASLTYPLILLLVTIVSVTSLLVFVVPKFSSMFVDMGVAIPESTAMIIAISEFLTANYQSLLLLILSCVFVFKGLLANHRVKLLRDSLIYKSSRVGQVVLQFELTGFCQTLALMLKNGVTLNEALNQSKTMLNNQCLRATVDKAHEALQQGRRLSSVFRQDPNFPMLASHLIALGEEASQLSVMLQRIGKEYDRQIRARIKRLLALLEPIIVVGLGAVIAFIIVTLLNAVMSINDAIV